MDNLTHLTLKYHKDNYTIYKIKFKIKYINIQYIDITKIDNYNKLTFKSLKMYNYLLNKLITNPLGLA
jgi:hypothetical protein